MTNKKRPSQSEENPSAQPPPADESRDQQDAGNAIDSSAQPPPAKRLNRSATVLIGALLAILGFALAVQLRSNATTDSLTNAREDDLVRILDDQNSRIDRLQGQISDLQSAKLKLSDSGSNTAAAREEAQKQADALAVLTGTVPAHGPGLQLEISDPAHAINAEGLLDVVEELRGAGAEVIQFGPVRITTSSNFTDSGSGVVLDGTVLQAPYDVLAIGDPKTMDTALNIPSGVVSTVRSAGGNASITEQDSISITAIRPVSQPKYATPTQK